jgi:hypothetical protein
MSQNVAHIYYGKCHERWVAQLGSTRPLPRSESGLSGFGLGAKALDWAGGKASGAMRRWGCRWLSTAVAAVPRVRVVGGGGHRRLLRHRPAIHRSGWGSDEPVGPEEAEPKKEGRWKSRSKTIRGAGWHLSRARVRPVTH